MTTLHLDDEERAALIGLLRRALDTARYPPSPRWGPVKAILARLDPPPAVELPLPIRSGLTPRKIRGRRRG